MDRVLAIEAEASGKTPQQVRAQYTGGVSLRSFVTEDDIADTSCFWLRLRRQKSRVRR